MDKIAKFQGASIGNYDATMEIQKFENQVQIFIHPTETEDVGGSIQLSIEETHDLIEFLREISNYIDPRRN